MEQHTFKRAAFGSAVHAMLLAPVVALASLFFMLSCAREYDNNRLVFARAVNGSYYNLFTIDDDGSNERRITSGNWVDYPHSWSSDGSRILFASNRSGNWDIYTIDDGGSNLKRLTDDPSTDDSPSWSPDGQRIAFVSNRSGFYELYLMDADGGNVTQLTNFGVDTDEMSPSWSPDGKKIVFVSINDGYGGYAGHRNVYTVNSDGSSAAPEQLTFNATTNTYWWPTWSPDGSIIIFVSVIGGVYDLYMIRADGTDIGVLAGELSPAYANFRASFSPDGSEIVFHCEMTHPSKCDIYKAGIDGTGLTRITKEASDEVFPCYFGKPR